jgi:hypothetical protein
MKMLNINGFSNKSFNAKRVFFTMGHVLILMILIPNYGCNKMLPDKKDIPNHQTHQNAQTLEKEITSALNGKEVMQVNFPQDDPGAPLYVRTTRILNQLFITDGWLVMPFHRDPQCVREDFNLLELFDAPAAFSCKLMTEGFFIIEKDAPIGTLPISVQSTGSAVPFWFVRWEDFSRIAADGVVTISDISNLNPITGIAHKFKEILKPRFENHLVNINASGVLEDGRSFSFHVTHVGDQTKSIRLDINEQTIGK